MALLIEKVDRYKPKVIGLDIYFDGRTENLKKIQFFGKLSKTKNLVGVSVGAYGRKHRFIIEQNISIDVIIKRGFANLDWRETIGTSTILFSF